MSVGAGSIKRAAKKASVNTEQNMDTAVRKENMPENTETAENGANKTKTATRKPKTTAEKSKAKTAEAKPQAVTDILEHTEDRAEFINDKDIIEYTAYGIGQQLPVHLL